MLKLVMGALFTAGIIINSSISRADVTAAPPTSVTCAVSTQGYVLDPNARIYPEDPKVSKLIIPIVSAVYIEGSPDLDSKDLYRQEAGPYTLFAYSAQNRLEVFITKTGDKKQLITSDYDPKATAKGVSFTGTQLLLTDSTQGSAGIAYRCYPN